MNRPAALPPVAWRAIAAVLAAQIAVLTALSGRYGFHRDELYFMVAGHHPAWGYTDQPPLTPILARVSTTIFGDSPMGLRVVATLMAATTVLVATLTAREFGAGRGGQLFTAIATALSTYPLVVGHLLATASADLLIWAAIILLVLRALRTGDGRWWIAVGAVVGVGILNKWLVVLLVAVLAIGILVAGPRRSLLSWWLLAGAVLGLAIATPTLIWQASHDWPQWTVARGISEQDGTANRIAFVPEQLVYLSPILVPVWLRGITRLWREPALRWAKFLTIAYPLLCVFILASGGKPYYAIPLQLPLLAAGAEPVVRWLRARRRLPWTDIALAVVCAVISLVIALPLLPPRALGPVLAANPESGEQIGWPGFVGTVATAWRAIPATKRGTAVIFTANYGQAGAIDRYGSRFALPAAYSGHMSYADWGPPPDEMTGPVLIVGWNPIERRSFTGCRVVARNDNGFGLDNDEQGTELALCDGPAQAWSALWPSLRHFY